MRRAAPRLGPRDRWPGAAEILAAGGAIYFAGRDDRKVAVVRLPPEGFDAAGIIARIPTRGKGGPSSIDASDGEVYVALADPTPRFFMIKGG